LSHGRGGGKYAPAGREQLSLKLRYSFPLFTECYSAGDKIYNA